MKLKRDLGLLDVFCIASGAMISSGLFILPGIAHAQAGSAVVLSYLIAGLLATTAMLSQAEIVSAMPKAGGDYFYINRTMGPAVGTVGGLMTWFSLSLKTAFALVGMAAFAKIIIDIDIRIIGVALCLGFFVLNLCGVKKAGKLQVFLVVGLFVILILYVLLGLPHVRVENLENFMPNGLNSVFTTAGLVFVAYGGLLNVPSVAEEVKDPGKTIPLGMILSLLFVTILYVLVVFVTTGVLEGSALDNSLTPISDGAQAFLGKPGQIVLSIAAILAFISTGNAGIMASARYPLALSRDKLIPQIFKKVNKKFQTPHVSLIVTTLFISVALCFELEFLVKTASAVLCLAFIFSCLCVVILRESNLHNYQPKFKAPLYPWIQIIGVVGSVFLIIEMGTAALFSSTFLIVAGFFAYWFYGRIRSNREFALMHLVERITNKDITQRGLERELRTIIKERDEIIEDRFDNLIKDSLIFDLKESIEFKDFFALISEKLSGELNLDKKTIETKLLDRENDSPTVISPTLAIPHIIIEGENKFHVALVRCNKGIKFSDEFNAVKTVFILFGTKDERNFHLRALAAIAQIVQDSDFKANWLKARTVQELKDSVLLVNRSR